MVCGTEITGQASVSGVRSDVRVMAMRVQKTVRFCCTSLLTSCESLGSSSGGGSLESLDQLDDVDWVCGQSDDAVNELLSSLENLSVSNRP